MWEIRDLVGKIAGSIGLMQGPFNFAISAWQNLLYSAGWDPAFPRGTVPCGDGGCNLIAYGSERSSESTTTKTGWTFDDSSVNAIVLITNGLSFAFQAVLFLAVGSLADYGVWRPHITTAFTLLAWGVSFGWLGVETASKWVTPCSSYLSRVDKGWGRWQSGTALYILGLIGYQGALTFWTAAFPGLARDLPEVKESEEKLARGEIEWVLPSSVLSLSRHLLHTKSDGKQAEDA